MDTLKDTEQIVSTLQAMHLLCPEWIVSILKFLNGKSQARTEA